MIKKTIRARIFQNPPKIHLGLGEPWRMSKMSRMSRKSRMFRYGRGFATSQNGQLPRLAKRLRSVSRKDFSLDPEFVWVRQTRVQTEMFGLPPRLIPHPRDLYLTPWDWHLTPRDLYLPPSSTNHLGMQLCVTFQQNQCEGHRVCWWSLTQLLRQSSDIQDVQDVQEVQAVQEVQDFQSP